MSPQSAHPLEVYGPLKEKHHDQVIDCVHGAGGIGSSAYFNWSPESLRSELLTATGWGFWLDEHLVAFVLWRDLGEEAEITVLATDKAFHGRGHMKQLLGQVFGSTQYKIWLLEVHEANERARKLYEILGFHEVGRRNRYYRDGAAALRYQRIP